MANQCMIRIQHTWSTAVEQQRVSCKRAPEAVRIACRVPNVSAVSVYSPNGTRRRFAVCSGGRPARRRRGLTGSRRRRR